MEEKSIWLKANLGEISKEIKPGYPSGKHNSVGNGKLHFRPYNISNEGEVNLTQTKFVPLKNEDYYLKSHDIIFNNTNSPELLGKTCIINKDTDWVYSNHMTRIRLKPKFDPRFFAKYLHYLKYTGFYKVNCSNHVNQASIASGFLNRNLKVPICPFPEQRAIVSKIEQLFSELDNGISNLKLAQEQLKVYRQAVLKKAFEGKLTRKWREQQTDLPDAGDLLEQIRKEREKAAKVSGKKVKPVNSLTEIELDELLRLPEKWKWVKVGELCDVVRGGSPRPAGDPKYYGGEIPFLKVADITRNDDVYVKKYEYTIKEAGLKKTRLVERNTLLLSNSGATLGIPKICSFKTTFNDGIAAFLELAEESLVYHYYFWLSKTKELRAINQGAAQPNLNTDIISNYPFPLCSLPEQQTIIQEIETRLSVCDKIEQDIEMNLEKAEALRQSILKKAFEGKLLNEKELAEARGAEDWEPAEVLLEGIKAEKAGNLKKGKPATEQLKSIIHDDSGLTSQATLQAFEQIDK